MSRLGSGPWLGLFLLASCDRPDPGGDADWFTRGLTLHVAPEGDGNGTFHNPYGDIQAAVDAAEAEGGGTVRVRPGTYTLTAPIRIMGNDIVLQGSGRAMCVSDLDDPDPHPVPCENGDDGDRRGWHPNGHMMAGTDTRLEAPGDLDGDDPANGNIQAYIRVGCGESWRYEDTCPDTVQHGVVIRGMTMAPPEVPRGGIDLRRAVDFEVEGNVIESGQHGMLTTGSTGRFVGNAIGGIDACGFCINAPLPDEPGGPDEDALDIDIVGNTVDGSTAAVFLFGASSGIRALGDHLDADVRHNALRNSGLGTRISPQIRPAGSPGFTGVYGSVTARLTGNEYSGNAHPYMFDDGFGFRRDNTGPGPFDHDTEGPSPCSPRWYQGDFDVTLTDEIVSAYNGPSQITFTRPYGSGWENWQYLHYSTYTVVDPDDELLVSLPVGDPLRVRIDNPTYDAYQDLSPDQPPFIDACASERFYDLIGGPTLHPDTPQYATDTRLDQDLHNTLIINGVEMPHLQGAEGGVDCTGPELSDCARACLDHRDNDGDGLYDWDDPDCAFECNADTATGAGTDGSVDYTVSFGETGALSTEVHGLALAETQTGVVDQDPFEEEFDPNDPLPQPGWTHHQVDVPAGTTFVSFQTYDDYTDDPHAYDLDLYVFDPLEALVGIGYTGTATERVDAHDPAPGTWDVWVNGWYTAEGLVTYRLFAFIVGDDAGNLTVSGPAEVTAGQDGVLTAEWTELATCSRYMGVVTHLVDGSELICQGETIAVATDADPSCPKP